MPRLKFYLAVIGFIPLFIMSFISLLGYDMQIDRIFIAFLFVGVFIMSLLAIFQIKNKQRKEGLDNNAENFYKIAFANKPKFFQPVVKVFGLYAFLTFALGFIYLRDGSPEVNNGKFILQNKGELIRVITETEYHFLNAKEIGLITGVLLFFSVFSIGYYYPFNNKAA